MDIYEINVSITSVTITILQPMDQEVISTIKSYLNLRKGLYALVSFKMSFHPLGAGKNGLPKYVCDIKLILSPL